jgi:hypothetical protein
VSVGLGGESTSRGRDALIVLEVLGECMEQRANHDGTVAPT